MPVRLQIRECPIDRAGVGILFPDFFSLGPVADPEHEHEAGLISGIQRNTLIPGYSYNGSPITLSEFGGIAFIPPGHQAPAEAWGYSGVEKTADGALERLRGLYQAIARIPAFAGICYTQLTDVEQEINGLLTYDRKPKYENRAIKEINDALK